MTGETHKKGGMLVGLAGFLLLRKNGLLLPDVNEFVQLMVIYPFALWGSTASDLDHHWESAPTKDGFSWCINKALHLTTKSRSAMENLRGVEKTTGYKLMGICDAKHRSWQTHSDLTLITIIAMLWVVLSGRVNLGLGVVDISIVSLILVGIGLGVVAHFILDMLTPQGIWMVSFMGVNKLISLIARKEVRLLPEKLHFVPKWSIFATGSGWESLVCKLLSISTVVLVVYVGVTAFYPNLLDTLFPYEIHFNY